MFANVPNKVCKKPYCFELFHFMKTFTKTISFFQSKLSIKMANVAEFWGELIFEIAEKLDAVMSN